jgi:threonine aldolase
VPDVEINLYSDTQTRPTAGMRRAMADAEVGDEQRGHDPTVNALCERAADLLGKEAALFLPSGTMCNQIGLSVHCRPGDEIIADETAHVVNAEAAGAAALAGALIRPLRGSRGVFTAAQVSAAVRVPNRHAPRSRLVVVENTANLGGGTVWPMQAVNDVAAVAARHQLSLHMDGARLMNAVVQSGTSAADYAAPFESVWIDLSKGLGCPVGALLAGSRSFIEEAWVHKHRLGGAMRQAGIIAAAGLYALDHHVDRLAEDHANAARFAELVAEIDGVAVDVDGVQSNMVYIDVAGTGLDAITFNSRCRELGVDLCPMGATSIRVVTHLDVSRGDIDKAAGVVADVAHLAMAGP